MIDFLKRLIRNFFIAAEIDITKNIRYDRLTRFILKRILFEGSNCIDVGSHKGEILKEIVRYSPTGVHYAFEPIPEMCQKLQKKFKDKVTILPFALSDHTGETEFLHVKNAPAYSGINRRKYGIDNPDIEKIKVPVRRLDDVIPDTLPIDFIKIDVEGGELDVMKGASRILKANRPTLVFECGLGATEYYGTKPEEVYEFLCYEVGLSLYLLRDFAHGGKHLSIEEFLDIYQKNDEYYFVAHA